MGEDSILQEKLVTQNINPTESDDIRYSERPSDEEITANSILNNGKKSDKIEEKGSIEFSDKFDSIFNQAISEVPITKVSMKVFPPYNESQSDANEQATRWAHNEDVKTGAQAITFYHRRSYLIEKFDSTDLKYLIIGRIKYDDYRNIRRELEANAKSRKEESVEELATVYDKRNRQRDSSQRRGQSADSVAVEYRGKSDTIQRVDKDKDSKRKTQSNTNRSDERNSTNRQNRSLEEDTLNSERNDTDIYDVMGEKERILKENEKFKAEIERLNERLKIERKVTHGNYFNEKQLGMVAGHLRKISNSSIDKLTLMKSLKEVYSFIAHSEELAWEDVYTKCYGIADAMLKEAKPITIVDDYSKHLLREIRNTRISLDDAQKAEAQHHFGKNWNRSFMGKVIISNDGINIDSQWQEWSNLYPEVFSADTNSSDR